MFQASKGWSFTASRASVVIERWEILPMLIVLVLCERVLYETKNVCSC